MPNVRDSSGTIGTTRLPICLSRSSVVRIRTNAIVVEIVRSPVRLELRVERRQLRHGQGLGRRRPPRPAATPPSASRRSRR